MTTRLQPGDTAPAFTLTDDTGGQVSLSDYAGRNVIVYFYPAAMTPGCTKQACDFSDSLDALAAQGYAVLEMCIRDSCQDLAGRTVGHDHPVREDHRALAQLQRIRQVVGDHEDRHVQAGEDLGEFPARGRVEVGGGFIEDEDLRPHRQHRRHGHSPTLPERQVVRRPVGILTHPHRLQGLNDPEVDLGRAEPEVPRTEGLSLIHI